jgi:hypothetical protein
LIATEQISGKKIEFTVDHAQKQEGMDESEGRDARAPAPVRLYTPADDCDASFASIALSAARSRSASSSSSTISQLYDDSESSDEDSAAISIQQAQNGNMSSDPDSAYATSRVSESGANRSTETPTAIETELAGF